MQKSCKRKPMKRALKANYRKTSLEFTLCESKKEYKIYYELNHGESKRNTFQTVVYSI
jgi:hypothetical protein